MSTARLHDGDTLDAHHFCLERLEAPRVECFACYEGVVYIGHLVEEDGEEREIIESVPCRRCAEQSA